MRRELARISILHNTYERELSREGEFSFLWFKEIKNKRED